MDSNTTTENTLRIAAYVVGIGCALVFIVRVSIDAIPLLKALAR